MYRKSAALCRRWARTSIPFLFAFVALVFASNAGAAAQRNLKEEFGPAAKPRIDNGSSVVVDHATGDILISRGTQSGEDGGQIERFHADGTPAPFEALGTNVIDGEIANERLCPEEPASCDATPLNGIETREVSDPRKFQVAIDESGGVADGDIYLSEFGNAYQETSATVYIFAATGSYLGRLTEAGGDEYRLNQPTGVAVDEDGAVYVADAQDQINVFVPTRNPVADGDFVANIPYPESVGKENGFADRGTALGLAVGTGPTAGSLFAAYQKKACAYEASNQCGTTERSESIVQFEKESGRVLSEFDVDPAGSESRNVKGTVAVNPTNGNVLDGSAREFEVRSGSEPVEVSHVDPDLRSPSNPAALALRPGLAVNDSGEVIAVREIQEEVEESIVVASVIDVFGVPRIVPTVTVEPATDVTGTRALLSGTVDAGELPLAGEECYFQYGPAFKRGGRLVGFDPTGAAPCEGSVPPDSAVHPVRGTARDLEPETVYGFSLVAVNQNGQEETRPPLYFTTVGTVVTEPASAIGLTTATLNGSVLPEGSKLTDCSFEYGLASSASFEDTVPCDPRASSISPDFRPHQVDAGIADLQSEADYRYRLVVTSETFGVVEGEEEIFTTLGLPAVVEARAGYADESSVTLEARINPGGFGTSYRFEWGQTPAYGNVAPLEFEPFVGSGTEPVLVKARLSGLAAGTAYHYRVVAESSRGVAQSADQVAETLNSCGLPEGRCFEEVSRREAGPVAIPGESNALIELHYQASTSPGGFAYAVESGYPDATKGAEVLYRGVRTPAGWESAQLSAPLTALNERSDQFSQNSSVGWISDDLSCNFLESTSPLTPDPSMNLVREAGGANLYRSNPDGSYTPVTTLAPRDPGLSGVGLYPVAWGSQDCGVTVFTTPFTYAGIEVASSASTHLYEWRNGTIRNAGLVPGPAGEEVVVGAIAGAGPEDTQNSVSADGSRIFLTAARQAGPDPDEIGKQAVFVREVGSTTRDVSLSQTSVPDEGATYQWATADGSKVFFIANTGLARGTQGSGEPCLPDTGEGCELYEYDLQTGVLTDRTATRVPGGAQVRGFLGASADGSRVYFASSNRLVPGDGASRERNLKIGSFSVYSAAVSGGSNEISFAGTLDQAGLEVALIEDQESWSSQVSPDGRYLLFESGAQVTDYRNEGVREAYLYDAGTGKTKCVSCRQDGRPSAGNRYGFPNYEVLPHNTRLNLLRAPRYLTERNGEAQVFFNSPDPLAPGAVAGQNNVYEWTHDQIFRLVSAPEGSQRVPHPSRYLLFGGASEDATDVYLITPETLTWEDGDRRASAYDARVGGGFTEPGPPAPACLPGAERSCAPPSPPAADPRSPESGVDVGPQNAEPKKKRHKQHKKKRRHHKHRAKNHKRSHPKTKAKAPRSNDHRRNSK